MSRKHIFAGVTSETLGRLPQWDDGSFELQLDRDRIGGTLTRRTGLGEVVVRFNHDNERAEMTVTIVKKPMLMPTPLLLAEMSLALRRANGDEI